MQHRDRCRLRQFALFSLLGLLGCHASAVAEVPTELEGKWSSHPGRCEPVSGEVEVLTITAADLGFHEVGCELDKAIRSGRSLRFDAQCYKGGSPVTPGKVVLRRHAAKEIDLTLEGFSWIAAKPQRFRRC
ncbi:hypothetical protein ASE66_23765 [Bosea sp. Root483D1]|uniref:hypothetical protein n=1 Tax=Bosea sp. Root483D1 TaxID=1736544 RepID=UPI00070FD7B0|nr:hypothetical protein [Bosea sp. Root483D1]KRE11561.1 hypothetical protein ASE66_23765 [Bosea sp. Root483D1]